MGADFKFDSQMFATQAAPTKPPDTAVAKTTADGAYEQGSQNQVNPKDVDTSVISIERPFFGLAGATLQRINLDTLVGKKGLKIYSDMRLDEQVKAAVNFKRDAILSRGWSFEFDTETTLSEDEQKQRIRVITKIIEKMPGSFIDALNVISTGREFGYSLTEKVYSVVQIDGKNQVGLASLRGRDPASFEFHVDPFGDLVSCFQVSGGYRIPLDLDKFIHYVHNPEFDVYLGRSDLREAYRAWYFKEQTMKFWGFYMEKLGGGLIVAKVTQQANIKINTAAYSALTSALSSLKASGSVLLPLGVEAEVVFPTNSDSFDKALDWNDRAIAKALLVPNLLGVSNNAGVGSHAQSQTQLDAFAWTVKADTERLENCLNEQLFKDLGEQNWGDGEYPCLKFKPMDTEHGKWLVETWQKLVLGKVVLPTTDDEKRLREILEMPVRTDDTELVVDPMVELQAKTDAKTAKDATQQQHDLGQKAADAEAARGIKTDVARATHPVLAEQKAKEDKVKAAALAKKSFGFNPDQPREADGKWGAGSGGTGHEGENGPSKAPFVNKLMNDFPHNEARQEHLKTVPTEKLQKSLDLLSKHRINDPDAQHFKDLVRAELKDREHAARKAYKSASPARDARISIASARERVDFAVIDRKQRKLNEQLARDMSVIVARGVAQLLGTDADLAKLTDADTSDIGMIEFSGITKGRLKSTLRRALDEAYVVGKDHAKTEIRGGKRTPHINSAKHFADLRTKASEFFDNNAFRMAGNVSDGVRALLQQELQNSVKYGKSPKQTRETIWDRLTSKGFAAREDVRNVETDPDVIQGLDALWVDDEEAAAHYLDTLARTNLFEAMNEARYAEFKDPALDGFVVALRYSAILDDRTTQICESLDDHVYLTDNEVWETYRPPNHYNCRSILIPVTEVDAQQGEWDGEESDAPDVEPQEGFK